MSQTQTIKLELPDEVAEPMRQAAERSGQSLEEWALSQLRRCAPSEQERRAALDRLLKRTVSVPEAVGIDNESIDRDLAREYSNTHEEK